MQASPSEISHWKEAVIDGVQNLLEKKTLEPIPTRDHRTFKLLYTHVVSKIKRDNLGTLSLFKAFAVVGGYFQAQGPDLNNVF